jgi:hypothetical protein
MRKFVQCGKCLRSHAVPPYTSFTVYCHGWEGNVTYKYVGFGVDSGFIVHSSLNNICDYSSTMALSAVHSYSLYSVIAITHSLQFTEHTPSVLFICCSSSPRVPAAHGRRSPSWIPELSPSHSHSNTSLTVHTRGTDYSELSPVTDSTGPLSYAYFTGALTSI